MSFAVIARDDRAGNEVVLHRFAESREQAAADVRPVVSAHAINEQGKIELSSHAPMPPEEPDQ